MPRKLIGSALAMAAVAGCTATAPSPPSSFFEPGCRDAESTMTVMVDGQQVTQKRRECQQPDGSWKLSSMEPPPDELAVVDLLIRRGKNP